MGLHWYRSDNGQPQHEVFAANGNPRPATLRDARKLNLVPSVTNIIGILDKPGLLIWKEQQLFNAVLEHPYQQGGDVDEWKRAVKFLSAKRGRDASERGRELHDKMEKWVANQLSTEDVDINILNPVIQCLRTVGDFDWIAEKAFAYNGYGGTCDLHCVEENGIILDFKTKDTSDIKKLKGYTEHIMQLAAYREGLGLPKARCMNLFFSTQVPGMVVLQEYTEEEVQKAYKMFTHLKDFWKLYNNYDY